MYDISFFKKYFQFFKRDRYQLVDSLDISENQLDQYISGEKLIDEDMLNKILDVYGYYNYDELKENINNKRRNKQVELTMKKYKTVSNKRSNEVKTTIKEISIKKEEKTTTKAKPVINNTQKEEKRTTSNKTAINNTSKNIKNSDKQKKSNTTAKDKPIIKNDIQPKKRKGNQIHTAYDLIGCTKEEFEELKKDFTEEDKRIYKRAIGDNDDKPVRCNDWSIGIDKVDYQHFILRKKTELKYLNEKSDNSKKGKIPPKKLYDLLGITKDELQTLKKDFTEEDKRIYKRAIGDDDDKPVRCEDWNYNEDKIKYNQFVARQRRKLKKKKVVTIYERIGCTKEEYALLELTDEDNDLINRKNGKNLDKPKRSKNWTQKDKENYNLLIRRLQTQIKHIRDKDYYANNRGKGTAPKPLKEIIGCTQKEVDYLLLNLSEKEKNLYDRATGADPTKPKRSNDWSDKDRDAYANFTKKKKLELGIIRYLYGTGEDINYNIPPETLDKYIEAKEEIGILLSSLSEKQKKLYDRIINYKLDDEWTLKDSKEYYYLISDRQKKLEYIIGERNSKGKTPDKATKLLKCSKYELNEIINLFNENEKELFERANGDDLNNPRRNSDWTDKDQNKYHNLIKKYRRYLINQRNENIKIIYNFIINVLNNEKYNELLENITTHEYAVATLKINCGFSNSAIQESLGVDINDIFSSSRKLLKIYRTTFKNQIDELNNIVCDAKILYNN